MNVVERILTIQPPVPKLEKSLAACLRKGEDRRQQRPETNSPRELHFMKSTSEGNLIEPHARASEGQKSVSGTSPTIIQWLAWFYCANFLFIVILSHWPGLTDAQGRLMGLFAIDPIDDIFHLISGLAAAVVAWRSHRWSVNYFKIAGIPYAIDAVTGIFFSVEFLNGDLFTKGVRGPDLSIHNLLVNLPHILIPATMLWIGFWLSKRVKPAA